MPEPEPPPLPEPELPELPLPRLSAPPPGAALVGVGDDGEEVDGEEVDGEEVDGEGVVELGAGLPCEGVLPVAGVEVTVGVPASEPLDPEPPSGDELGVVLPGPLLLGVARGAGAMVLGDIVDAGAAAACTASIGIALSTGVGSTTVVVTASVPVGGAALEGGAAGSGRPGFCHTDSAVACPRPGNSVSLITTAPHTPALTMESTMAAEVTLLVTRRARATRAPPTCSRIVSLVAEGKTAPSKMTCIVDTRSLWPCCNQSASVTASLWPSSATYASTQWSYYLRPVGCSRSGECQSSVAINATTLAFGWPISSVTN